jgi:hypothetical protein
VDIDLLGGIDQLDDQLTLMLGEGGEHIQHQPAGRGCRVEPLRRPG